MRLTIISRSSASYSSKPAGSASIASSRRWRERASSCRVRSRARLCSSKSVTSSRIATMLPSRRRVSAMRSQRPRPLFISCDGCSARRRCASRRAKPLVRTIGLFGLTATLEVQFRQLLEREASCRGKTPCAGRSRPARDSTAPGDRRRRTARRWAGSASIAPASRSRACSASRRAASMASSFATMSLTSTICASTPPSGRRSSTMRRQLPSGMRRIRLVSVRPKSIKRRAIHASSWPAASGAMPLATTARTSCRRWHPATRPRPGSHTGAGNSGC